MSHLSDLARLADEQRRIERSGFKAMRALIDSLKYPVWLKDADSRMVLVNMSYAEAFGVLPRDYEGKTDFDIWPKEIAETYRENDLKAISLGEALETFEVVTIGDRAETLHVVKTPIEIDGKTYVKGEAFLVLEMENIVNKSYGRS